jgi:hypothetical protein
MKDLVTDAISFFKMVGASDELAERNFDNKDIMTVEYCNEIVELCRKYGIECDDTMPYGILDAEYALEKFFKETLEGALGGE